MPTFVRFRDLLILIAKTSLILVLASAVATAATVTVDCSGTKAKIKTIAAGLAVLPLNGPNTLFVSGTCVENVSIRNYQYLTVQGNPSFTIDGGTAPGSVSLAISDSHYVTVNDVTILGGSIGIACGGGSICRLNIVTVQNGGVLFGPGTSGYLNRSTIQDTPGDGLTVDAGSTVGLYGSIVQGNGDSSCGTFCGGVFLQNGATLRISRDLQSNSIRTYIQNNPYGYGIRVRTNSTINIDHVTISGNGTDGVQLMDGSVALFDGSNVITANTSHGLRIGDLSMAVFRLGSNNLTGNVTSEDIVCDPKYSTKRTNTGASVSGTTNCGAEEGPNP